MAEKRREAEAAVDLMSVQFERNRGDEEKRNGLIIIRAIYGKIVNESTSIESSNENQIIDVTIPLQCLVKDSRLTLQESGKVRFEIFFSISNF